jgi:cytochrome P450
VLLTDPENYDKVYAMNTKYYKDPSFYTLSGANTALFAIVSNEDHRRYRAILNPFFSRRSVLEQEEIVQGKVAKLIGRIEADSKRGVPTDISVGFRAISVDVITEYAFGADRCWNSLDREDLGVWYNNLARTVVPMMYVFKIVPALRAPMQAMPYWLAKILNPIVTGMMDMMEVS